MVPEPSMISPPMPLSGADTGCDALYMASVLVDWLRWVFDEGSRSATRLEAIGPDKGPARQATASQQRVKQDSDDRQRKRKGRDGAGSARSSCWRGMQADGMSERRGRQDTADATTTIVGAVALTFAKEGRLGGGVAQAWRRSR